MWQSALADTIELLSETVELKSLRRLALASLGRNVLHFQRLESQLKLVTLFCDFESPVARLTDHHKHRTEKLRTKTFGGLVSELNERLYGKPIEPSFTEPIIEAWLNIGFRIDGDHKYISEQKRKLQNLVAERNQLIHHDLSNFDPSSAESCRIWIARLDDQNQRILERLATVQQLIDQCRDGFNKLLAAMEAQDWKRGLEGHSKFSKKRQNYRPRPPSSAG